MKLKGLLFDMDGTLVDNLAYHFMAFDAYAEREGFTLLEPVSLRINGMHSNDIFPLLLGDEVVAQYGLDRLNREKEEVYRDMYRPKIAPIAGVIELLKEAKKAGVKCAIGSSGCRENVEMIIEGLGIAELIDGSISGSDVTHGKPHPEIFTKAHEALGLKAEECIVVEDAVNGIVSGVRAGCKCLAVTTTATAEELTEAGASLCVEDYSTVTIEQLNELLK
ncbi:MAG: HAD family phosphatase [Alistipes sp.]|nr:HAD family phosphatase [Alistipes sp.]